MQSKKTGNGKKKTILALSRDGVRAEFESVVECAEFIGKTAGFVLNLIEDGAEYKGYFFDYAFF